MPTQEDYNKALWLAFGQVIKDQVAPQLGPESAIFFSSKAQLGPPANDSNKIPPPYTNMGIYNIGNNLLPADSFSYVPSQANSYIRSLLAYLNEVDLLKNENDTNRAYLTSCLEDQRSAQKRYDDEKRTASKAWEEDMKMGFVPNPTPFPVWLSQNGHSFNAADNNLIAATARYNEALRKLSGPQAIQYEQDRSRIDQAINKQTLLPGITMEVTGDTPLSAAEIDRYVSDKQSVPAPAITYAPAYNAPDYASTIKSWISNSGTNATPHKQEINFDKGKTVDESSFNHTSAGVSLNFPTPWFTFSASGSDEHEESSVFSSEDQQQIKITVFWDDMRAVSIYPGNWDIKDFTQYPLKDGAKNRMKPLVRPTQMVLVNRLGYEMKFEGTTKDTMTSKMRDVKEGKIGFLRVFGIDASVSNSDEKTSHTANWDEQNCVLTLNPTSSGLQGNICAIVGDRINIA